MGLLAGIGIGAIIAAVIGWFVAISNHRQAWINALRDDLATYLKELEVMHHAIGNLLSPNPSIAAAELERDKQEARVAILYVYRRILLRLNAKEEQHRQLVEKLDALMTVTTKVPAKEQVDEVVTLACEVLKREWEVTKWGPLWSLRERWKGRSNTAHT